MNICSAGEYVDSAAPEPLPSRDLSLGLTGDESFHETLEGCSGSSSQLFDINSYTGSLRCSIHRSCSCCGRVISPQQLKAGSVCLCA